MSFDQELNATGRENELGSGHAVGAEDAAGRAGGGAGGPSAQREASLLAPDGRAIAIEGPNGDASHQVELDPRLHGGLAADPRRGAAGVVEGQPTALPQQRHDIPTAIARYPLLVLVPALILAALGGFLGHAKANVYTARSQVLVEQPGTASTGALPGLIQSEQSLASVYAREIDSNSIVGYLAARLHTTPGQVASHLSASPDPQVPIVRISATAGRPGAAIALANAAAARFASQMTSVGQSTGPVARLIRAYRRAAAAYEQARARQLHIDSTTPNQQSSAVIQANVAASIAQLHENALASQYQDLVAQQQSAPAVRPFLQAQSASDDRTSNTELYAFVGLAAGLVIGAALATLFANRKQSRGPAPT
jgi:hypothetical protein